jgi:hypothetical protein
VESGPLGFLDDFRASGVPQRLKPRSLLGVDTARVELVPFPIKVQTNVKGSGQECPLHMIYAIRGELPDAIVARVSA